MYTYEGGDIMDIGEKIKSRRKELGLTLEDIGKAVGVSKSTVKKWETGYIKNMKRDKIDLLANILQISPLDIIGNSVSEISQQAINNFSSYKSIAIELSEHEKILLDAYRNQPDMQKAVDRLLGIFHQPQIVVEKPSPPIVQSKPPQIVQNTKPMTPIQREPMLQAGRRFDGKPTKPRKLTEEQWEFLEQGDDLDLD